MWRGGAGISLQVSRDKVSGKARASVLELLKLLGRDSRVFEEAFGPDDNSQVPPESLQVMYSLVMAKLEPKAVLVYTKEVSAFVWWVRGFGLELAKVRVLMLCSFVRMSLARPNTGRERTCVV